MRAILISTFAVAFAFGFTPVMAGDTFPTRGFVGLYPGESTGEAGVKFARVGVYKEQGAGAMEELVLSPSGKTVIANYSGKGHFLVLTVGTDGQIAAERKPGRAARWLNEYEIEAYGPENLPIINPFAASATDKEIRFPSETVRFESAGGLRVQPDTLLFTHGVDDKSVHGVRGPNDYPIPTRSMNGVVGLFWICGDQVREVTTTEKGLRAWDVREFHYEPFKRRVVVDFGEKYMICDVDTETRRFLPKQAEDAAGNRFGVGYYPMQGGENLVAGLVPRLNSPEGEGPAFLRIISPDGEFVSDRLEGAVGPCQTLVASNDLIVALVQYGSYNNLIVYQRQ